MWQEEEAEAVEEEACFAQTQGLIQRYRQVVARVKPTFHASPLLPNTTTATECLCVCLVQDFLSELQEFVNRGPSVFDPSTGKYGPWVDVASFSKSVLKINGGGCSVM